MDLPSFHFTTIQTFSTGSSLLLLNSVTGSKHLFLVPHPRRLAVEVLRDAVKANRLLMSSAKEGYWRGVFQARSRTCFESRESRVTWSIPNGQTDICESADCPTCSLGFFLQTISCIAPATCTGGLELCRPSSMAPGSTCQMRPRFAELRACLAGVTGVKGPIFTKTH